MKYDGYDYDADLGVLYLYGKEPSKNSKHCSDRRCNHSFYYETYAANGNALDQVELIFNTIPEDNFKMFV